MSYNRIYRLGGKRNHKRVGRVQLGIKRAFIAAPDRALSTTALMEWAFPLQLYRGRSSNRHRMNYSRSIRRAADRLCDRVGRLDHGVGRPWLWRLKTPLK
jgi:hypothetical protein